MKDSGIELLGEIPTHWDVKKLKNACKEIFLGLTSKVDYVENGNDGVPLVRALNIAGGKLDFSAVRCISKKQHKELTKYRRAQRNDILLSKSGSIGTVAIVDTDQEFSIYESIFALRGNPKYLIPPFHKNFTGYFNFFLDLTLILPALMLRSIHQLKNHL